MSPALQERSGVASSRLAVNLDDKRWLAQAKRIRKLADREDDVQAEFGRLVRRASWLRRKAARLPLRSNGRRKALGEAMGCELVAEILTRASKGESTPKLPFSGKRHLDRAAGLVHELQAV